MDKPFEVPELTFSQVQIIVRGMVEVAKSDGVHPTELVLIREFYEGCRRDADGLTDFPQLITQGFDVLEAKEILDTPELRNTFMVSCLLVAFADGDYSDAERTIMADLAGQLGISHAELATLLERVKDHLLLQLAKVSNVDALVEITSKMK
jgi:uncharacterized membrane protein YebE (DUF533 family)